MHFTIAIYYIIISKFQNIRQKFKNSPIVKRSTSQVAYIIHDASMEFENCPIITVREGAFFRYYMLYHYFKISKICQKIKNNPIVNKSTSQVADIIFNVCMKFENYPMKTVLGDAFYSYNILYHYFKISKIRQKIQK